MTAKQQLNLNITLTNAYNEYGKLLTNFALHKLNNREIGKDLVQQTFMKAWLYLTKGGEIFNMKVFLYRILNNLIIDEYRKHKTASLEVLLKKGFEPGTTDPKCNLNSLSGEDILTLIDYLPESYKEVMRMRYSQDLSIKQMAAITGKSKNSISVQIYRGLKKLKTLYVSPVSIVSSAGIEPATTP